METTFSEAIKSLQRTPSVLNSMLRGLPERWIRATEGGKTWSCYDVVGHLIQGEETDWVPRIRIILSSQGSRSFEPFDRFAQFKKAPQPLGRLLTRFQKLRAQNLSTLKRMRLRAADLSRTGIHPELGTVTLGQLISTWVVHDHDHIVQISRILAKQYTSEVGPWKAYLGILNR